MSNRVFTVRPKWREDAGGVAPSWDVAPTGMPILYVGYQQRLIGGHNGDYHCICGYCAGVSMSESKQKEEAMAVSKAWDKQPPAGVRNPISVKTVYKNITVDAKYDDDDEIIAYHISAPRNKFGLKLLAKLDDIIRRKAEEATTYFGWEDEVTGDTYFSPVITIKVETVPVRELTPAFAHLGR